MYKLYIFKAVEGSNTENYCQGSYPSIFFRETTSLWKFLLRKIQCKTLYSFPLQGS